MDTKTRIDPDSSANPIHLGSMQTCAALASSLTRMVQHGLANNPHPKANS